jgi:HPt (histidine-containing phosphotransfer) domain-containing protein
MQVLLELKQVMGDDLQRVIFSYLQHSSQLLTEMKHKADEGNLAAVIQSVHSFKSSSKNVGAIELGEKARKLEEQLRAGESVDVKRAVQELVVNYAEVSKALQDVN